MKKLKKLAKWLKSEIITLILKITILDKKNIKLDKKTKFNRYIHMSIDKTAKIIIGRGISSNQNVFIRCRENSELCIGENVALGNNLILTARKKIVIGNDVMIGPNVLIFDHDHDYKNIDRKNNYKLGEIFIGKNVWIGGGAIILKNTKIGDNAVIAAGAVVNCEVPENCIYYGKGNIKKIS